MRTIERTELQHRESVKRAMNYSYRTARLNVQRRDALIIRLTLSSGLFFLATLAVWGWLSC